MPVATVCRFVRPGSLKAAKLLLFSGHHTNEHKTWSQSCCPFHVLRPSHCPVCEVPTRQNQSVQKTPMSMMSSHSSWPTEASLSARELLAKIQIIFEIIHNIAHFYTLFNKTCKFVVRIIRFSEHSYLLNNVFSVVKTTDLYPQRIYAITWFVTWFVTWCSI